MFRTGMGALALWTLANTVAAQSTEPPAERAWAPEVWRVDAGVTFARFEQQVKTEVGGAAGDRLVEEGSIGLQLHATYRVLPFVRLGVFTQYDAGIRRAAALDRFDADGAPITRGELGGRFGEWWLGPLLRLSWRTLFAEAGWGAVGMRWDGARDDLPGEDGNTDTFRTSPRVAWLFGAGAFVPVRGDWSVALRVQYRIRYYTSRGGTDLADDVAHGTQNISPFIGVGWRRGRAEPK